MEPKACCEVKHAAHTSAASTANGDVLGERSNGLNDGEEEGGNGRYQSDNADCCFLGVFGAHNGMLRR